MSTGLGYAPGIYSDTNELVDSAEYWQSTMPSTRLNIRGDAATWRPAIEEAMEIGRRNGAAVQISRMEAHYPNWGAQGIPLRLIEEARAGIAAFTAVATCSPFPGTRRLCQIDPHQRRSVCWRPESSWARAFSGGLPGFMSSSVLAFCGHGAV